jgi:hypothetical protein
MTQNALSTNFAAIILLCDDSYVMVNCTSTTGSGLHPTHASSELESKILAFLMQHEKALRHAYQHMAHIYIVVDTNIYSGHSH